MAISSHRVVGLSRSPTEEMPTWRRTSSMLSRACSRAASCCSPSKTIGSVNVFPLLWLAANGCQHDAGLDGDKLPIHLDVNPTVVVVAKATSAKCLWASDYTLPVNTDDD